MNKANGSIERIKIGLVIVFLAAVAGCAGFWGEGYYGDAVVGPDLFIFGGDFDRGREEHNFSHRGFESRRVAHPSGGRGSESRGAVHPGSEQRGRR